MQGHDSFTQKQSKGNSRHIVRDDDGLQHHGFDAVSRVLQDYYSSLPGKPTLGAPLDPTLAPPLGRAFMGSLCSWNIWGLNWPNKQEDLKVFLHTYNVDFIGLLETKVKVAKVDSIEPPHHGSYYSWTNKKVWSRIDRAFINTLWNDQANFTQAKYLPQSLSDHTPLMLQITASPKPRPSF
ncbi:LOW QUALITY PROTEIN: hypothetical protein Cgig2_021432 [Carnegiea gigantea]|uniref:Uncharacterized protein n=1 Tax=Carnegiea gigantea TaxID=171969 RepID=A0A9Q1GI27_9CARY|nr:LOW QUALITY PROTEIN: hypothetical protein Cgig2_021432 [Carnegiea gigantea]